jgi:predicted naringenin-chalcone synthase
VSRQEEALVAGQAVEPHGWEPSQIAALAVVSVAGGTVLASSVIVLGAFALPSLTAYRVMFGICAGAAVLGAAIALVVPGPKSQAS